MTSKNESGRWQIGRKLLVLAGSLAFAFVLVEVVLQIFIVLKPEKAKASPSKETHRSLHEWNDELGWVLEANISSEMFAVDSLGLRNTADLSEEGRRDAVEVLLLGDSMVFGASVRQPEIFSELLNAEFPECRFINTGVCGYSTAQEYLVLKKNLERFRPSVVILFYTQANDMWTNGRETKDNPYYTLTSSGLKLHAPRKAMGEPLCNRLATFQLIDRRLLKGRDFQYLVNKLDFAVRGETSVSWTVTKALLREINRATRAAGAEFVLVNIPTQREVWSAKGHEKRHTVLRDLAEEECFAYFDLREHYPTDARGLFLPNDSHWNPEGHRFIKDFVAQEILELGSGKEASVADLRRF